MPVAMLHQFHAYAGQASGGFMDALPDPMKLSLTEVGFTVALLTLLYLFLKRFFFKPVVALVDQREQEMAAGALARGEASSRVEASQAEYEARLKELRHQAQDRRKALAGAAAEERRRILEQARAQAETERQSALTALVSQGEAAKSQLLAQVDTLAESMARQLLKQA